MRTIEAIIEADGRIRLLESVELPGARRALVTVLEELSDEPAGELPALISEPALAEDWNRAEEDAAWAHLQPEA